MINKQRCIEFLISEVGLPESFHDKRCLWESGPFRDRGSILPFELVLDNDPIHYERPLSDRFLRWKWCSSPRVRWNPRMISSFLWQDGRPRKEDIMSSLTGPISILHWISFHAGTANTGNGCFLEFRPAWQPFLSEVLGLCQTDEPHHVLAPHMLPCRGCADWPLGSIGRNSTALFEFLCGVWSQRTLRYEPLGRSLKRGLRTWLSMIKEVYHLESLENYGKKEFQAMEQFLGRTIWNVQPNFKPPAPILLGIEYGARVQDWEIEWDMEEERFVGEFWQLVESQSLLEAMFELPTGMPGSWVEEAPTPSGPVSPPPPEVGIGMIREDTLFLQKTGSKHMYRFCKTSNEKLKRWCLYP